MGLEYVACKSCKESFLGDGESESVKHVESEEDFLQFYVGYNHTRYSSSSYAYFLDGRQRLKQPLRSHSPFIADT